MKGRGEGRRFEKGQPSLSKGRPRRRLRDDPNRYALAEFHYHVAKGKSADWAAQLVAWIEDAYIEIPVVPMEYKHLIPAGKVLVYRERPPTPGAPATFLGRGRTIQKQVQRYRQANQEDAVWLQTMTEMLLLTDGYHSTHDKALIFELAEKISEEDFYIRKLVPQIDARNGQLVRKAIAGI
jgi:hypothetical protein